MNQTCRSRGNFFNKKFNYLNYVLILIILLCGNSNHIIAQKSTSSEKSISDKENTIKTENKTWTSDNGNGT